MSDLVSVKTRLQYARAGDTTTLPLAVDVGIGRDWVSSVPTRRKEIGESIPTSGITFSMADFTTIATLAVWNEDTTNYVTVAWTSGAVANSQRVPAGQSLLLPQADIASVTITANTAACTCTLVVFGS